jgi:plasminogen activator inhibitor 1 RNA-binding protein
MMHQHGSDQDTRFKRELRGRGRRGGGGGARGGSRGREEYYGEQREKVLDTGMVLTDTKEHVDFLGKHEGFQGKPREKWHPYDRKSGTGRGKELPKSGHGKGNWGNLGDELKMTDMSARETEKIVPS